MKLIRLIENVEDGHITKKFMCSNYVYKKLLECQNILGHLSYDVDLWEEKQNRAKTDWDTIQEFLENVFAHLPAQHLQHILNFILTNKR